jgi:NADPH-dependent 2,4-dienoyl-CoA reductase/sulfur reductase-like enzyme
MKSTINRRDFLKFLGFSTASFVLTPSLLKAATNPSIVVVGGGFAGATCAKYLKLWGGSSVDVTVIEENANYVSPILSNLVLNSQKVIGDITFGYQNHANTYQINMVHKKLVTIDKDNKSLILDDSSTLSYDYLVLAPGIDFSPVSGHDFTKVPHGWIAGTQTTLLKQQIDTMVDGDEFVMSIPKSPYRCPPGPYERACVVAHYLKNVKGYSNSKVTVLDANADIIVEKDTFGSAFTSYGVDYIPNATITAVNSDTKTVTYDTLLNTGLSKTAKVLNIIPNQKAASLIFDAGLNSGNWASVDAISYESTITSGIYIIGDSQGTSQPKAGHIGNAEAKVCADAILRKINNVALYANPKTNSACYSPISTTQASWLTVVYEYDSTTKDMKPVSGAGYPTAGSASSTNYKDMFSWSTNLFKDTFY